MVLWNLNVNYVTRDLLTQIPRECKKELNTSYKSSQSYSRGWETDCTLCSFEPTMKVKWCQRCKRKQRRSMMVATPHVSPAIRQVETRTVLETVGLAKQVRSCLPTPLLSRPPGTAIGKLWICLMWVTDKEMFRLQINIARFCRQSWMLIYVGGEFYTLWPDPGVRGKLNSHQ